MIHRAVRTFKILSRERDTLRAVRRAGWRVSPVMGGFRARHGKSGLDVFVPDLRALLSPEEYLSFRGFWEQFPDGVHTYVDVGAYVGLVALVLDAHVGGFERARLVEPSFFAYYFLTRNVRANPPRNWRGWAFYREAVGATVGECAYPVFVGDVGEEGFSLRYDTFASNVFEHVHTMCLFDLIKDKDAFSAAMDGAPVIVKIDCEGGEDLFSIYRVIQTVRRVRRVSGVRAPFGILVEVHGGEHTQRSWCRLFHRANPAFYATAAKRFSTVHAVVF